MSTVPIEYEDFAILNAITQRLERRMAADMNCTDASAVCGFLRALLAAYFAIPVKNKMHVRTVLGVKKYGITPATDVYLEKLRNDYESGRRGDADAGHDLVYVFGLFAGTTIM